MIRLTDTTLMHLPAALQLAPQELVQISAWLAAIGADCIEMPATLYEKVIGKTDAPVTIGNQVTVIQINDIREIKNLRCDSTTERIRLRGLDDILTKDYKQAFSHVRTIIGGDYELCPQNSYGLATATAVEWIYLGGQNIVTAFGGIGNRAPTEEVLMALRINKRHRPNQDLSALQSLKIRIEALAGIRFSIRKPVMGSAIFHVEAGIHANGIAKDPYTYEPYDPTVVGNERALVVGKHSGSTAIRIKLDHLKLSMPQDRLAELLKAVQAESIRLGRSLIDAEFKRVVEKLAV